MVRVAVAVAFVWSLLALLLPATGRAASYRFVVLADSASEVKPIYDKAPSIDEDGSVAFLAGTSVYGGSHRLLVASEPGAETFAEYTEIASGIGLTLGPQQIGSFTGGKLAYLDYLAASPTESIIYRAAGGAPPVAVQTVTGSAVSDAPAMNGLGQVAFLQDTPRAIVVTDGEDATVVAASGMEFGDGTEIDNMLRPGPDVDGVGRVAYFASIAPSQGPICDDRILLSGTNPPLVLATGGVLRDDCPFRILDVTIPIASNNAGSAAFSGNFSTPGGSVEAVFVDQTAVWETRISGFEEIGAFPIAAVALNDTGTVAFLLEFSGVIGRKLYVGPDAVEDRVIGRGDALCDGVVSDIEFHRFGLNDAGELAIGVRLADDRRLIVRAEPTLTEPGACITVPVPEPASGGAVAGAALALLAWRRRAGRRCASSRAGGSDMCVGAGRGASARSGRFGAGAQVLLQQRKPSMRQSLLLAALAALLATPASATVIIDWVPIGNAGNPADTPSSNCYASSCGSVAYDYWISKYEVTNAQYAELLNAKAASDSLDLYNTGMGSDATWGGITRSGVSGSYSYAVKPGFANKPVNYVSFYDSIRFANWLSNGQGSGDTETGAYTLLGGTAAPSNGLTVTRNGGANIFLTSENEWYKAAYYSPGGVYFDYPTGTNSMTGCVAPGSDTGNSANCYPNAYPPGSLTNAGAYGLSDSPYGTYDQGGNVWEWNEEIVISLYRGLRGGGWGDNASPLAASNPDGIGATNENFYIGFRVASLVPEPGTGLLGMTAVLALALQRKRTAKAL